MHRPTIGVITVTLLAVGFVLWFSSPARDSTAAAACLRIGTIMAALWLAVPQLQMLPGWVRWTTLGAVAVGAWRPKALLFMLPVLVLLAIVRPRWGKGADPRRS